MHENPVKSLDAAPKDLEELGRSLQVLAQEVTAGASLENLRALVQCSNDIAISVADVVTNSVGQLNQLSILRGPGLSPHIQLVRNDLTADELKIVAKLDVRNRKVLVAMLWLTNENAPKKEFEGYHVGKVAGTGVQYESRRLKQMSSMQPPLIEEPGTRTAGGGAHFVLTEIGRRIAVWCREQGTEIAV